MFDLPILDIFITLAFTYFILSVIASSIKEILSTFSKIRGKMLWDAMEHWIDDQDWNKLWNDHLSQSAFITSLRRDGDGNKSAPTTNAEKAKALVKKKFPSYIPAENFVQAVLGLFRNGTSPLTIAEIRTKLNDPTFWKGGAKTREWLLALLDKAENEKQNAQEAMIALEKHIAQSFDNSMERVTGWYKKRAKKVLLFISIAIAFSLNIDTVEIAAELWKKPEVAAAAADAVGKMLPQVKQDSLDPEKFTLNFADDSSVTKYVVKTKKFLHPGKDSATTDTTVLAIDTLMTIVEKEAARIGQAKTALGMMNIPMGWQKENYPSCYKIVNGKKVCKSRALWLGEWFLKLIGLLLTAAALTLGAPFWFELVNKLVNLRGSGSRPMTYDQQEQKKMRAQAGKK